MANGQKEFMERATLTSLINECIARFIKHCDDNSLTPAPDEAEKMLLGQIRSDIMTRNTTADKTDQWQKPSTLPIYAIGELVLYFHNVKKISLSGEDNPVRKNCALSIYLEDEGVYTTDTDVIDSIISAYSSSLSIKQLAEVRNYMALRAEVVSINDEPNLIAVNNGIYDTYTHALNPFSPDYVFISKSPVDYNINAQNVHITMPDGVDWDCDYQIRVLSGNDLQMEHFLWQNISAALRHNVDFNKSLLYYGEGGCNGKGTMTHILKSVVGSAASYKLSISDMAKDFMIAGLRYGQTFIYSDEADVGEYIDKAANFKLLVTHDTLLLNEKYEKPISYRYRGIVVQNINEIPRVKDSSNSFIRRIIIVPFNAKFEGQERKYIKTDYLNRKDVLEYYLKRALEMDFTEFDIPDCCFTALDTFKQNNDPVFNFWHDFKDLFVWNVVPVKFIYELYKSWAVSNNPQGGVIGYVKFWQQLRNTIEAGDNTWENWSNTDDDGKPCAPYKAASGTWSVSTEKKWIGKEDMAGHEPLIITYKMENYYANGRKNDVDMQKKADFIRPTTVNACIIRNTTPKED